MDREQLIERCKDYQDLSAMKYTKARRYRGFGVGTTCAILQIHAAFQSARARRILFYLVTNDPRELFEP